MPAQTEIYHYAHPAGGRETLPVVLVHGAGGTHNIWPLQIRRLAGFRVYAPDLPGHGKSGGHGYQSVREFTAALTTWMDRQELGRAAVVGHSLGGAIALELALSYPDRAAGLGLIGTGARMGVRKDILENASSPDSFPKAVAALADGFFTPGADPRLVQKVRDDLSAVRPSVLHGDLTACNTFDVTSRLGEIDCPVLVISGAADWLTPERYARFLVDRIRGAKLAAVPNAAHMVMLQYPAETARILSEFLGEVPYQAGR